MLKALLRTLPNLSGNVKMAFNLRDFEDNDKEIIECNIRDGNLLPLSSNLYSKNIKINLITSSYEFDIHNYYICYKNIFFNEYFIYDKKDISLLDKYKEQLQRNTDFEFGLKRTSYKKNQTQFEFFAPLWMESVDDIPDYFLIKLELSNKYNNKTKYIKINIGEKRDNNNYIYIYLKKYLSKIDNNVIYCTPFSNQATYYGISLNKGGFIKFIDNEINKLYNNFNTIINFDYFITAGFKRNELVIRQILPLCFKINVIDYLTEFERLRFKNCEVKVSGVYFKDNKEVDFYDFESNYENYYHNIYSFNNITGNMELKRSDLNLFNLNNLNILHESKYKKYLFVNKLTKNTTKWKLKYSDDNIPYITNLNWGYSFLQGSGYKYGLFPQKYTFTTGLCVKKRTNKNEVKYNLILPFGTTKEFYQDKNLPVINEYKKIMDNYCFNWFNLIDKDENIFENKKFWKKPEDNKVYYKGILYNLNNIKNYNASEIDRFGVFFKYNFTLIDSKESNNLLYSNYSINLNHEAGKNIVKNCNILESIFNYKDEYKLSYNGLFKINGTDNDNISENEIFIKKENGEGNYININDFNIDYYEINRYYSVSELVDFINKKYNEKVSDIYLDNYSNILNINSVEGYKFLNIYNYSSISLDNKKDIFSYYYNANEEGKYKYNKLYQKIYFTEENSSLAKTKFYEESINSTLYRTELSFNEEENNIYSLTLFLKDKFISYHTLLNIFSDYGRKIFKDDEISYISYLRPYEFKPVIKYKNREKIRNCFVCDTLGRGNFYGTYTSYDNLKNYNDIIWVQQYNLNNIISYYNTANNKNLSYYVTIKSGDSSFKYIRYNHKILKETSKNFFCKLLNLSHLKIYNQVTFKDIDSNILPDYNTFDNIYIRLRNIDFIENTSYVYYDINLFDYYIPLSYLIKDEYKENNKVIISIYDFIDYSVIYNKFFIKNKDFLNNIYNIPEYFDLGFYDKFIKLDDNIMNLINLSMYNSDLYKDIYLYILEKPEEYYDNLKSKLVILPENNYKGIKNEIDNTLKPFFNDASLQKMEVTLLYNNYILNKINKISSNEGRKVNYYKYNTNDVNLLLELPKGYTPYSYINNIKLKERDTYDKYKVIDLNVVNNENSYSYLNFYKDLNSGLLYAYYLFNIDITNTSNSFDIIDEYGNEVNIFNYVDSLEIGKYNYNIPVTDMKNLFPFLKINILTTFNYMNTIVYPKLYNFEMNYKEYPILESYDEEDNNYTYDIKTTNTKNNISLLRYFDSITPYITKTSVINDSFNLKYKGINMKMLNTGYYINNGDSVLYKENLDINHYNNMKIYNNPNDIKHFSYIYCPTEYKHFNDNKIINLDTSFEYEYEKEVPYEKLHELEDFNNTFNVFKKIILSNINDYDDDKILFLFNKYTVNYETYPVKLNLTKTEKLYKLIYKFNLL